MLMHASHPVLHLFIKLHSQYKAGYTNTVMRILVIQSWHVLTSGASCYSRLLFVLL